jgi:hypothetical protein
MNCSNQLCYGIIIIFITYSILSNKSNLGGWAMKSNRILLVSFYAVMSVVFLFSISSCRHREVKYNEKGEKVEEVTIRFTHKRPKNMNCGNYYLIYENTGKSVQLVGVSVDSKCKGDFSMWIVELEDMDGKKHTYLKTALDPYTIEKELITVPPGYKLMVECPEGDKDCIVSYAVGEFFYKVGSSR